MGRFVAGEIARRLKQRIEAREWPGDRLPPERDLAAEFGVARNTIRHALTLLARESALERQVGRGTFAKANSTPGPDALARIQGASPADVMELRLMLEPGAAAFAATNASASQLAHVAAAHEEAVTALDMPAFERWDAEFHHRIVACSRNDLLREVHDLLRALRDQRPWFDMKRRSFSEKRRGTYCRDHADVLSALVRRDPEQAREAMSVHLQHVRANMLGR